MTSISSVCERLVRSSIENTPSTSSEQQQQLPFGPVFRCASSTDVIDFFIKIS